MNKPGNQLCEKTSICMLHITQLPDHRAGLFPFGSLRGEDHCPRASEQAQASVSRIRIHKLKPIEIVLSVTSQRMRKSILWEMPCRVGRQ